jgi:hypothetical protein
LAPHDDPALRMKRNAYEPIVQVRVVVRMRPPQTAAYPQAFRDPGCRYFATPAT